MAFREPMLPMEQTFPNGGDGSKRELGFGPKNVFPETRSSGAHDRTNAKSKHN